MASVVAEEIMSASSKRSGKRSRSMMTMSSSASASSPSSSAILMLATLLSIMSSNSGNGVVHAASFASSTSSYTAAFATAPTGDRMNSLLHMPRHAPIRLSAKNRHDLGNNNINNKANMIDKSTLEKNVATLCTTLGFSAFFLINPLIPHLPYSSFLSSAHAEDELYAKYGGKGLDTSLVDKDCLLNHCSLQAKACLQDDPDCRKGLTCTAKCLGDNSCITGCFAKYGNSNLDNLLKCTIEDHECIKVAILEGGADKYGEEPASPAPTVQKFDLNSMEGTWYKVAGYNPNYDCYACQRNTFSSPQHEENGSGGFGSAGGLLGAIAGKNADRLQVDVEFSMPRLLDDGSPPPPSGVRETFVASANAADINTGAGVGLQSVGYNQYSTHETMVFDTVNNGDSIVENIMKLGKKGEEKLYSRTAHSEGEMFGLKFWENWYIIGQNDPYQDEFKFIYYNGKTRQNTYDGAFVYSRTRTLSPSSMEKVYQIAKEAGMNPDQFCKIQNNCFENDASSSDGSTSGLFSTPAYVEREGLGSPTNPFRGILASTRVSEMLGVESVAAESIIPQTIANDYLKQQQLSKQPSSLSSSSRPWWKEVADYLEDPRRHFRLMDSLRTDMDWPEYIKQRN